MTFKGLTMEHVIINQYSEPSKWGLEWYNIGVKNFMFLYGIPLGLLHLFAFTHWESYDIFSTQFGIKSDGVAE